MEDKEFTLEALKRLIPNTSWHGDSYLDGQSLKNLDVLGEMLEIMVDELMKDCFVPEGNRGNSSFEAIAKKKQSIMKWVYECLKDYFEEEE